MRESDLIETRRVLTLYGDDTLNSMKNILLSKGKNASGNLINSLSYNISYNGSNLDIEFSMPSYGEYVDKGRRPGKQPPISAITPWLSIKGIPQSAAFPIAKKIGAQGIKATPFFENSIESRRSKLLDDLTRAFTVDLQRYMDKQIEDKFN